MQGEGPGPVLSGLGGGFNRVDTYDFASVSGFKFYDPVNFGKNSVVFPKTDVETGVDLGPPLTDDNIAGFYELTTVAFDT